MNRLIGLYPREWRERYEVEFLALLEVRPATFGDRIDVVRGAIDARLHPQVRRPGRDMPPPIPEADLRVARRLGFGAIAGAALWLASFGIMLLGPVVYDGQGAYRDGSAALPVFFAAMSLLSAGLVGQLVVLPRTARVARASAILAMPFLLLYGLGPWMFPFGLAAIIFVATLALAAGRAREWPSTASTIVVVACVLAVAIVVTAATAFGGDRMAGGMVFLVAGMVLVPAWLGIGLTLVGRRAGVPAWPEG
jgi:hypothetical protein